MGIIAPCFASFMVAAQVLPEAAALLASILESMTALALPPATTDPPAFVPVEAFEGDDIAADESAPGATLLSELDQRQNELLSEIDRLNDEIQATIDDWTRADLRLSQAA